MAYLERLCMNWERSLLNMRSMSLGYSFEPRPNSRALATEVLVVTIGLSINSNKWMLHSKKPVWRERTRFTGPEVWAAATSKVWRDSSRAAFLLPTQEDQRRLCSHGDTTVISIQSSCFRIPRKWHLLSFFANDTQLHALTFANKKKLSLIIIVSLNFSGGKYINPQHGMSNTHHLFKL